MKKELLARIVARIVIVCMGRARYIQGAFSNCPVQSCFVPKRKRAKQQLEALIIDEELDRTAVLVG